MVERSDIDPDIRIPCVEIGHRRTAIGAEASLGEFAGLIGLEFTLREDEGGSREPHRRAEESAAIPAAHRAMADVSANGELFRFVAYRAAEAATRDWNALD